MNIKLNQILKHPIISTVAGGLILLFLIWIGGLLHLPDDWKNLLTEKISVPLWVLIILSILLVCTTIYILVSKIRHSASESTTGSEENEPTPLSDNSTQLLVIFREADETCLYSDDFEGRWTLSNILLEAALDELQNRNLLQLASTGSQLGNSYCLTEGGVIYITNMG